MKLFGFECPKCDADYLRRKSDVSLCPNCKIILHLTGIFEVLGDDEFFVLTEESGQDLPSD